MTGGSERLRLGGGSVDIRVQVNRRARRIILRADPVSGEIVLVLPSRAMRAQGLRFAADKADWIAGRQARLPARIPFADGMALPLLGKPHRVRHTNGRGTIVAVADGEIVVGGPTERLERQVASWLRAEARRMLAARSGAAAQRLDAAVRRVTIRDPKSRWGSCSRDGALSYSWRLILAPETVLDYVVAHEVAHLREMNHSPRFWRLVGEICPDHAAQRRWLRENGAELHRYG